MNLVTAGLDLLYMIMLSDNRVADDEVREMMHFLVHGMQESPKPLFPGRPNLSDIVIEMGLLTALGREELAQRVRDSGIYFRLHATERQKRELLTFARKIVRADGKVLPDEAEALRDLEIVLTGSEDKQMTVR